MTEHPSDRAQFKAMTAPLEPSETATLWAIPCGTPCLVNASVTLVALRLTRIAPSTASPKLAPKFRDVWVIPANTPHGGQFEDEPQVLFISSPIDDPDNQDRVWLDD